MGRGQEKLSVASVLIEAVARLPSPPPPFSIKISVHPGILKSVG